MYKNLNLNRGKIIGVIKNFCSTKFSKYQVSDFINKGTTRKRVEVSSDIGNFYVDFQFCSNGTTSIETFGGQSEHVVLKEEIAKFIVGSPECIIGEADASSKCFIAQNIDIEEFHEIAEILKESDYCKELNSSSKDSVREIFQFKGVYNESLSLFYYPTNKKVMVQGRPLLLFNDALVCITELVDLEKIPELFKDYYKIEVDKANIEKQVELYLPYSHNKHSPKLRKVLSQCIYNLNLDGDMFDYTQLAFPVYRALEGHLKNTLYCYSIECDKNGFFSMFKHDDSRKKYYLDTKYHSNIGKTEKIKYFEDVYNYYHTQRVSYTRIAGHR